MNRVVSVTLGIFVAGALAACAPREDAVEGGPTADTVAAADQPASAADSVPAELLGTTWRLVEFDAGEPVPDDFEITAEFRPGGIAAGAISTLVFAPQEGS